MSDLAEQIEPAAFDGADGGNSDGSLDGRSPGQAPESAPVDAPGADGGGVGESLAEGTPEEAVHDADWSELSETESGTITVDGRYRLDLTVRHGEFDTMGAVAVGATSIVEPDLPLYALIGRPGVPMNYGVLASLRRFEPAGLATRLADEIREMPGGEGRCLVVVVNRPLGGSIAWDNQHPARRPTEDKVRRVILPQILDILEEMERAELCHGAVHPENIFYQEGSHTNIMLGECFSEAPGIRMPLAFEPIERAMADPVSRGEATPASDMYAVGVTLLALLQGCDLFYGRDHREFLVNKVIRGSYNALSSNGPLPAGLITLLNGLLIDDPLQRWNLHEVKLWVTGTAPRARANTSHSKPTTQSVTFAGHIIHTSRMLAYTMNRHPDKALEQINDEGFRHWLREGIFDAPKSADVAATIDKARQRSRGSQYPEKVLLAQICRILDRTGPVRLGNMALRLDGLGFTIAMAFHDQREEAISVLSDAISGGYLYEFIEALSLIGVDPRKSAKDLERIREFSSKKSYGNGMKRCLYELNAELPCQSPLVRKYHVTNLTHLMMALEDIALKGEAKHPLLDAHMAAFIASQAKGGEVLLEHVHETRQNKKENIIMTLGLLELLQRRYCAVPLLALSNWFAKYLCEIAEPLYSKSFRDQVLRKLDKLSGTGDLPALFRAVDFPSVEAHDKKQFELAVRELAANDKESERVRAGVSPRDLEAVSLGNFLSLIISYLVMFGSVGLTVYLVGR